MHFLTQQPARAADWPQWRGPGRNGVSSENRWSHNWPASGPRRLWKVQVGKGHSAPSIVGKRLWTMGNVDGNDVVWCLDAATGKPLWNYRYPCRPGQYEGPRATPTVHNGAVYTLSRDGLALCLDAATGRKKWQFSIPRHTGAEVPKWGFASSPLIEGDLVIYNASSAGIALEWRTGKLRWKSAPGLASYASPVAFNNNGTRAFAIFPASGMVAVEAATGRHLWHYPWAWNNPYEVNAADPIFFGDKAFISSGYRRGCALLQISGGTPRPVYANRHMENHVNTCVAQENWLYGSDAGTLTCLEMATGHVRWNGAKIGKGGAMLAGDRLIVLSEWGKLLVVRATPNSFQPLASAEVLDGPCYTVPVLANARLYCRNRKGELLCLDLSISTP